MDQWYYSKPAFIEARTKQHARIVTGGTPRRVNDSFSTSVSHTDSVFKSMLFSFVLTECLCNNPCICL